MLFPRAFVLLKPAIDACPMKMQLLNCKRVVNCVKPRHIRFYHRSNTYCKGTGKRSPGQGDYVFPMRDEQFRKGAKFATYGSFALGLTIVSIIFYKKVIQTVYRRGKGFIDIQDRNCSKSNMILYRNTVLPNFVEGKLNSISEFEVRENDVWIVGYPRSGMTWIQEIVFLVQTLDFEGSRQIDCDERIPYLEFPTSTLADLSERSSPRIIKTHLPLKLLPTQIQTIQPKIVYIARNPKDVVVSYFHLVSSIQSLTRYKGKLEDFVDSFLADRVPYSPWSVHVLDFWEIKDQPNVLFLTYEDLHKDLEGSIRKVAAFLEKELKNEDVQKIAKHCSFDEMKINPSVNHQWLTDRQFRDSKKAEFLRKGKVGDWKKYLSKEQDDKLNVKIALKLKQSGLFFQYAEADISDS